jgi:DNA-binding transcriptional ArsR family regulator
VNSVLQAITEPNRRAILELTAQYELSAGEIAEHFPISRPAVSQHITVLKQAGLLTERREGTKRLYRTRPEGFIELRGFLESFWDERLLKLKKVVEKKGRKN